MHFFMNAPSKSASTKPRGNTRTFPQRSELSGQSFGFATIRNRRPPQALVWQLYTAELPSVSNRKFRMNLETIHIKLSQMTVLSFARGLARAALRGAERNEEKARGRTGSPSPTQLKKTARGHDMSRPYGLQR